jgi:chromosome segregation ATPase
MEIYHAYAWNNRFYLAVCFDDGDKVEFKSTVNDPDTWQHLIGDYLYREQERELIRVCEETATVEPMLSRIRSAENEIQAKVDALTAEALAIEKSLADLGVAHETAAEDLAKLTEEERKVANELLAVQSAKDAELVVIEKLDADQQKVESDLAILVAQEQELQAKLDLAAQTYRAKVTAVLVSGLSRAYTFTADQLNKVLSLFGGTK